MSVSGVYGYCRVSTAEQATGLALESQARRIEAWALAAGRPVVRIFQDAGLSGASMTKRTQLRQALDECCAAGGTLVAVKLDRVARSVADSLAIAERLNKANADLVMLDQSIDTTTPHGKMFFVIIAAFAAFERDMIASRTKAGLDHMRQNGLALGNVPFGWMRDATWQKGQKGKSGTLVPEPREAVVLARMLELSRQGMNYTQIAATLSREGLLNRRHQAWHGGHIRKIVLRLAGSPQAGNPASASAVPASPRRGTNGQDPGLTSSLPVEAVNGGLTSCPPGAALNSETPTASLHADPSSAGAVAAAC